MDKRTLVGTCIAIGTLFSAAAFAQTTIYKQVDEDGRVIFTDQPRPNARTLSSYQTGGRPASRLSDAEVLERVEGQRRLLPPPPPDAHAVAGLYAPLVEPDRRRSTEPESALSMPTEPSRRFFSYDSERSVTPAESSQPAPSRNQASSPVQAGTSGPTYVRGSEVERAVFSYAPIASPAAAQVDAIEAGRRARQEASKASATPVLKVTPVAPERPQVNFKQGANIYYTVWALTFLLLAAGLLYVGWQVMRLILGEAFPRWHIGAG